MVLQKLFKISPFSKRLTKEKESGGTNKISKISSKLVEKNLSDEFKIMRTIYNGRFSKIVLVKKIEEDSSSERFVLKAFKNRQDLIREADMNYYLSPHPNIINCFTVYFHWQNYFLYPIEYAPHGSLARFIGHSSRPLRESQVKRIAKQISSALEFIHSLKLVFRNVVPENILIFKSNFSVIKLGDFGEVCQDKSLVSKDPSIPETFQAPEVASLLVHENYHCSTASDVWQTGILLILCLTCDYPWNTADPVTDSDFSEYCDWLKRKSLKIPETFSAFTPRFLRLLKRILEPKSKARSGVKEINKYLEDEWVRRGSWGNLVRNGSTYSNRSRSLNPSSIERKCSSSTTRSYSYRQVKRKRSGGSSSCHSTGARKSQVTRSSNDQELQSIPKLYLPEQPASPDSIIAAEKVEEKVENWILTSHI